MALKELFIFALFTIVMTMNWGTVQSFGCDECPPPPPADCFACPPRPNGCEQCPDVTTENSDTVDKDTPKSNKDKTDN